jgi:hypothetical protein
MEQHLPEEDSTCKRAAAINKLGSTPASPRAPNKTHLSWSVGRSVELASQLPCLVTQVTMAWKVMPPGHSVSEIVG